MICFSIGATASQFTFLRNRGGKGFTLVELLVAIAILAIMVGLIATIGSQTNQVWTQSSRRIEQFQNARNAFEVLTRSLAQATLNTYYVTLPLGSTAPTSYGRASDLEFVCGAVTTSASATGLSGWITTKENGSPLLPVTSPPGQVTHAVFFALPQGYSSTTAYTGLDNLLCVCGFYIQYSQGLAAPSFLSTNPSETAYRFRLMEVLPPSENFPIYTSGSAYTTPNSWIKGMWPSAWPTGPSSGWVHQVASNIIALIISPEDPSAAVPTSIAPNYNYDSWTNGNPPPLTFCQLPPVIHVTMVAIDEKSAISLSNQLGATASALPIDFGQNTTATTSPSSTYASAPFTLAANYTSDLARLQQNLASRHINSRVFDMRIPLRGSKWSSQ